MRNIDNAHETEDERQAQCGQGQHEGGDGSFQQGKEEMRAEAHLRLLV
jgi:hypothetical protein